MSPKFSAIAVEPWFRLSISLLALKSLVAGVRVIDSGWGQIFDQEIERDSASLWPWRKHGRIYSSTRLQKPRSGCGTSSLIQSPPQSRSELLHRPSNHLRTERSTNQTALRIPGFKRWSQDSSSGPVTIVYRTQSVRFEIHQMEASVDGRFQLLPLQKRRAIIASYRMQISLSSL